MNEAELVLTRLLNCDRLSLYLNKDTHLDKVQAQRMGKIFARRMSGEPLQYILGDCEFMGLEFKADSRALIPRPETEILVSQVLERLKSVPKDYRPVVLDLGTGSGCIAVAIAKLFPQASVWASDISAAALQLAKENAMRHKVKIKFLRSDIFASPRFKQIKFDLIVSNPPYVAAKEFKGLAKEISFEPALALSAGADGLVYYRRIISGASAYLKEHGLLVFEIGSNQAGQISRLLNEQNFSAPEIVKDYNDIKRVIIAKRRIKANG